MLLLICPNISNGKRNQQFYLVLCAENYDWQQIYVWIISQSLIDVIGFYPKYKR